MRRKLFVIYCEDGHKIKISEDDKGNLIMPKECPEPGCSVSLLKFYCPCCNRYHKPSIKGICPNKKMEIDREIRKNELITKFKESYCASNICEIGKIVSKALFYLIIIIAAINFWPNPEAQPVRKWMFFLGSLMVPIGGIIGFSLKNKKHKEAKLKAFLKDEAPDFLPDLKELCMQVSH